MNSSVLRNQRKFNTSVWSKFVDWALQLTLNGTVLFQTEHVSLCSVVHLVMIIVICLYSVGSGKVIQISWGCPAMNILPCAERFTDIKV